MFYRRLGAVLAKVESVYGVDSNPEVANNSVLTTMAEITFNGEKLDRNVVKNNMSPIAHLIGKRSINCAFEAEIKGSGGAGTPPAISPLLRACGLSETINAGVDVTYAPVSSSFESCTLHIYVHDLLIKILGCRGTCEVMAECGKSGFFRFNMRGIYAGPIDGTLPNSVNYEGSSPPVVQSGIFTIGGVNKVINKLEMAMNNTVIERPSIAAASGVASIEIVGRSPSGSIDPEAETIAGKDYWTEWTGLARQAVNLIIGNSGNRFNLNVPKAQFNEIGFEDREGILALGLPFACTQDSGDDEFSIKYD